MEVILNKENFEQEVLKSDKPVIVDFWATWCGPCKAMIPVLEEIANEMPQIKVGKVNVDDEELLARMFNIQSIPAFIMFENGQATRMTLGSMPKETLIKFINDELKNN